MNINNLFRILLVCGMILTFSGLIGGCATVSSGARGLLPTGEECVVTNWTNCETARTAFESIKPGMTMGDLKRVGFDPQGANVTFIKDPYAIRDKILGVNSSFKMDYLSQDVQDYLRDSKNCWALRFQGSLLKSKGQGNFLVRALGFNKKDSITGWQFEAWVFLRNDKVVTTTWKDDIDIKRTAKQKKPLGPIEKIIENAPSTAVGAVF